MAGFAQHVQRLIGQAARVRGAPPRQLERCERLEPERVSGVLDALQARALSQALPEHVLGLIELAHALEQLAEPGHVLETPHPLLARRGLERHRRAQRLHGLGELSLGDLPVGALDESECLCCGRSWVHLDASPM
jgi:hypothetical protein